MVDNEYYGTNTLDVTGPSCVGKMVNKYLLKYDNKCLSGNEKFGVKILSFTYWSNPFISYNGCKLLRTRASNGISESKFRQISGLEKYGDAWDNKRIYKCKILL